MSYFRPCPLCGANLDPGERCDCKKEAAQGASNTQGGKSGTRPSQRTYSTADYSGTERKVQV